MRFIFEYSLAPSLPDIIAILEGPAGNTVQHLRRFHPDQSVADTVWIPRMAEEAPDAVVVTADPRITKSPNNQQAWLESGLTMFFLRSFADQNRWEQVSKLVKWWPDIVKAAEKGTRGTGFLVSVHGKIEAIKRP